MAYLSEIDASLGGLNAHFYRNAKVSAINTENILPDNRDPRSSKNRCRFAAGSAVLYKK
jgi:hypothetical protein